MAEFAYDSAIELAPAIVRVVARNPSPMTGRGTNSYVLGSTDLIAIDPGPNDPAHIDAIAAHVGGRLRYIVATHAHRDHVPGARSLAQKTGATVLAFGARDDFSPDGTLADGDVVKVPGIAITAIHTPGHSSDHLCYLVSSQSADDAPRDLFSGDHILGGTTTVISPPDGDMAAYLLSLERLLSMSDEMTGIAPGHGEVIADPKAILVEYLEHRRSREREVLAAIQRLGRADTKALVEMIYVGYPPVLQAAARRSTWAQLRKLYAEGIVTCDDPDDPDAQWY